VLGDQRGGQVGEGLRAADRVVAEGLDAEQAPVGGKAELPQGGQAPELFGDPEVAGVVDGGLGAQRPPVCRVGPAGCPADPPLEPYVPLVAAYGSSKPQGRAGWQVSDLGPVTFLRRREDPLP
jgi:hypothetical protein